MVRAIPAARKAGRWLTLEESSAKELQSRIAPPARKRDVDFVRPATASSRRGAGCRR